jgi:selenoprotein W-related protein
VKGSGGIFEVVLDGNTIYSKHETGRFPEPGEVVGLIPAAH